METMKKLFIDRRGMSEAIIVLAILALIAIPLLPGIKDLGNQGKSIMSTTKDNLILPTAP